jgi:hypothetical protein
LTKILNYVRIERTDYCQLGRNFHAAFYQRQVRFTGHD